MNFRNSEDGLGKEIRCAVFVPVKFPKQGRVTQPEVRAQVNYLLSRFDERRGEFRSQSVRKGQKDKLRAAAEEVLETGSVNSSAPIPGNPASLASTFATRIPAC